MREIRPRHGPSLNDDDENKDKRLVILAGPHKTASTSTQTFFAKYIGNRERLLKLPVFANWTWPWFKEGGFTGTKGWDKTKVMAQYVLHHHNQTIREEIMKNIVALWQSPPVNNQFFWDHPDHLHREYNYGLNFLIHQGRHRPQNMILGTEEFDRFGDTPWSQRNGILAMQEIVQALKPSDLTIVVNYRTPRKDHWISIYKQVGSWFGTYDDFMCATCDSKFCLFQDGKDPQYHYKMVWEYLNSVSNPLGLVQELRTHNWKVVLIDMGGVKRDKLDIAHTTACEVMKVACNSSGMVMGVPETFSLFKGKKDQLLDDHEHDYLEWLLRQRDCAYKSRLEGDPGIEVLHPHSLWENCTEPADVYEPFLNTTYTLHLIQVKQRCPNRTTTVMGQGMLASQEYPLKRTRAAAAAAAFPPVEAAAPFVIPVKNRAHFLPHQFLLDAWMEDDHLHITIRIQQIILLAFGFPMAAFLFFKLRGPVARRRSNKRS
jgi:hypothetical protein